MDVLGLRQAEFAEALGEKLQRVQDILRKKQRPPIDFVIRIVDIFHVNGTWLLTGAGEPFVVSRPDHQAQDGGGAYVVSPPRDFEARAKLLREAYDRVVARAANRTRQPDPSRVAQIAELVYRRRLSDEEIDAVLDLLDDATDSKFWME